MFAIGYTQPIEITEHNVPMSKLFDCVAIELCSNISNTIRKENKSKEQ